MSKKINYLKLILINIFILLAIILSINIVAAVYLDILRQNKPDGHDDPRISLGVFHDKKEAVQIFDDFYRFEFAYSPFLGWVAKPFHSKTINIAENHLRITPNAQENPKKVIHLFGGSTMWGTGVKDDETIPGFLQKLSPTNKFINHGLSGYVSRQSLESLINIINDKERIDGVIFYEGVNDVVVLCRSDVSLNGHGQENISRQSIESYQNKKWLKTIFAEPVIEVFRKKIWNHSETVIGSRCKNDPDYAEKVANTLLNNWINANAVLSARKIPFMAILQPVSVYNHPNIQELKVEEFRQDYQTVYPLIQAKIKKHNFPWIADMTNIFDIEVPVYMDWAHVTKDGNKIAAEKMYNLLINKKIIE